MHTTLDLRARRPQLEPDLPRVRAPPELDERLDSHVLERVLQAGVEVRDELAEGTFVDDGSGDALCAAIRM